MSWLPSCTRNSTSGGLAVVCNNRIGGQKRQRPALFRGSSGSVRSGPHDVVCTISRRGAVCQKQDSHSQGASVFRLSIDIMVVQTSQRFTVRERVYTAGKSTWEMFCGDVWAGRATCWLRPRAKLGAVFDLQHADAGVVGHVDFGLPPICRTSSSCSLRSGGTDDDVCADFDGAARQLV